MKIKEIKSKNKEELKRLLLQEREKLQKLRFDLELKKSKNVREIRKTRKTIARILTLLNQKENE